MRLYRVFSYVSSAAADAPGGALFRPRGARGRADSPIDQYRCLYTTNTPEGAVAETFGRFDTWDRDLIEAMPASPTLPGSRFALCAFDINSVPIRDLNDARALLEENLRPSDVVTRDLAVTQAWASRIYGHHSYAGVQWWSYYNPDWAVAALWDLTQIEIVDGPRLLSIADAVVFTAAKTIARGSLTMRRTSDRRNKKV